MKKFPRIHSLGTINIIHHQEFFYEFHPFRTDFVGESGVGKSIITDLLQLIIVGSSLYESSTQSQGDRPFQKLVLNTGNSPDFAYAYINIEVDVKKFVVLGSYIEKSARQSEAFIIQKGLNFDSEKLEYLDTPLKIEDFEVNGEWLPIVDIETYFNIEANKGFKKFKRFTEYHKVLSKENLIPLEISSNNEMSGYAKILQAFSRKGVNVKSSLELQKFLFGSHEQQKYLKQYNDIVQDLLDNQNDYRINLSEIEKINSQKEKLKKLYTLKLNKEASETEYLQNEWYFLQNEKKDLNRKLIEKLKTYIATRQAIKELNTIAKNKIETAHKEVCNIESQIEFKKTAIEPYLEQVKNIKLVDDFLQKKKLLQPYDILIYHKDFNLKKSSIKRIAYLREQFESNNLEIEFSKKSISNGLTSIISQINEKINSLKDELSEIETLRKFNDYRNPSSLAYWLIENNRKLSSKEESIIRHFQDVGTQKPESVNSSTKYISNPEEILLSAKNSTDDASNNGFWINLSGLEIFILNIENQIFNNKGRQGLIEIFKKAEKDILLRKVELSDTIKTQQNLLGFINDLDEPKHFFEAWEMRDEIYYDEADINDTLLLKTYEEVKKILPIYDDKKSINKKYLELDESLNILEIRKVLLNGTARDLNNYKYLELDESPEEIIDLLNDKNIGVLANTEYDFDESSFYKEFSDEYQTNKDKAISNEQLFNHIETSKSCEERINELKLKLNTTQLVSQDVVTREQIDSLKNSYNKSKQSFEFEFNLIVKSEIKNDSQKFLENYDFALLAKTILPRVFKNISFGDKEVIDKITDYLEDIFDRNAELDKNKLSRIKDLIRDVQRAVKNQSNTARRIRNIFNADDKRITGGNKAVLRHIHDERININWLNDYLANLADSEVSIFNETGEYLNDDKQKNYVSIEEKIKRAYSKYSELPLNAVDIEELLNPFSYYSLSFKIETPNKTEISGSTGQTYTATALLCIAKLSLIQEDAISKPGLRFMTIDETEGIGSNFDMLREVAKKFDYQILSLSIGLVKLTEGNQHIFELFKNPDLDFINHHPVGILST